MDDETGYYYYGAMYYNPRVSLWLNVDPLTEKMPAWSPYAYCYDNPIKFIDPTGMIGESTHTDRLGNVMKVYDDGDIGVYRHKGNAEQTAKELDNKYSKQNTSAGGQRMGRTLTKYSFAKDGDLNKPIGKIDFGDNWNEQEIQWGMNESNGIIDYGLHAGNGEWFDLKSKEPGTLYTGSIMFTDKGEDVYGSRRDAGNFLVVAKAKRSILPTDAIMYGFGAFNASGNKIKNIPSTIVADIIVGGRLLRSPYYGEDAQSGSAILQGVKFYKKFSNNWFFPEWKPARSR